MSNKSYIRIRYYVRPEMITKPSRTRHFFTATKQKQYFTDDNWSIFYNGT